MKFSYDISPEENLKRLKCTGEITVEETIAHVKNVNADPRSKPGMNTLGDFSAARFPYSFLEISRFADFVFEIAPMRGKCRWAAYAPTPSSAKAATLFQTLFGKGEIEVRVFTDIQEAEAWVLGSDPLRPPSP